MNHGTDRLWSPSCICLSHHFFVQKVRNGRRRLSRDLRTFSDLPARFLSGSTPAHLQFFSSLSFLCFVLSFDHLDLKFGLRKAWLHYGRIGKDMIFSQCIECYICYSVKLRHLRIMHSKCARRCSFLSVPNWPLWLFIGTKLCKYERHYCFSGPILYINCARSFRSFAKRQPSMNYCICLVVRLTPHTDRWIQGGLSSSIQVKLPLSYFS